ncbi:hypothetical protein HJG60_011645 [Phyllostomus discolor]|uniref:Uncharacterized protein n=1 Tax=Phyllostomus discolor TaxID=89673 RepID=A0A833ZW84_9CHIR|nr:hypothetical protein HJG60_011645 [Phyllostomus discolor]
METLWGRPGKKETRQIAKVLCERGDMTDLTETETIISEFYKQTHTHKFDSAMKWGDSRAAPPQLLGEGWEPRALRWRQAERDSRHLDSCPEELPEGQSGNLQGNRRHTSSLPNSTRSLKEGEQQLVMNSSQRARLPTLS